MGGVCSSGIDTDNSIIDGITSTVSEKRTRVADDKPGKICSISEENDSDRMSQKARSGGMPLPSPASKTGSNKVAPLNSQGGARGKAVDVFRTIGNSVSFFHSNIIGMASNGREISILAFEVANTISKVANLSQSLSEENIQFLKNELSQSEGIKQLVSKDMEELLSFAAAEKRQEFDLILHEVIRFGKQCKNTKWHNLDHYVSRKDMNDSSKKQVQDARAAMRELTVLAQHTSKLYHELHALESFQRGYRRRAGDMELLSQAGIEVGENLTSFKGELNLQRKLVRSLQNKSLWSRNLDEIVEKLVNVMTWANQTLFKAFGNNGADRTLLKEDRSNGPQKLGVAGLALHYANIINQLSIVAYRPNFIPSNTRDALYRVLPTSVRTTLRSRLRVVDAREELTYSSLQAEMDKTLQWLVPIAANTIKAYQAYGRIGEWAANSKEISMGRATQGTPTRLETLYHADKEKTEQYIIELVMALHHLTLLARQQHHRFTPLRSRSTTPKDLIISQPNSLRFQFKSQIIKTAMDGVTAEKRPATGQTPAKNRDPGDHKVTESSKEETKDKRNLDFRQRESALVLNTSKT